MSRSVVILIAALTVAIAGLLVVPHLLRNEAKVVSRDITPEIQATSEAVSAASQSSKSEITATPTKHSHVAENGGVALELDGVEVVLPKGWELLDQPPNFFVQERARNAERGITVSAGAFPMELPLEQYVTVGLIAYSAEQGKQFDVIARTLGTSVSEVEKVAESKIGRELLAKLKESFGATKFELLGAAKTNILGTTAYEIQSKETISNSQVVFSRQFTLNGQSPLHTVLIGFAGSSEDVFQDKTLFDALRAQSPTPGGSPTTYFQQGIAKGQTRDFKEAIAAFTKAIELQPNFAEAFNARGMARSGLAKSPTAEALADYSKAIALKPDYAEAYYNRAVLEQAKGDKAGALADQNKVIELQPNHPPAYYHRAMVKAANGDYDGAMADFDKSIELKPDYALAYQYRGNLKKMRGDQSGAQADYKKALELKPR